MRIYLDEIGYPAEVNLKHELDHLIGSDTTQINFFTLMDFYDKITPVIDYWNELFIYYEKKQFGKLTKTKYQKIVTKIQKKYFEDLELRKMIWK